MKADQFSEPQAVLRRWLLVARTQAPIDVYTGVREQHRYPWNRSMELKIGNRIVRVLGRDISLNGIGLVCREQLKMGDHVALRYHPMEAWVPGMVAHVTPAAGPSRVGIQVTFDNVAME
jgi:hypothetical protein